MPKNNNCAYNGCDNSARKKPDLSFHRFPRDDERFKKWIVLAGRNEWLEMEPQKLQNQRICSAHFEKTDYIINDRANGKPVLKTDALPAASTSASNLPQFHSSAEQATPIELESCIFEVADISESRDVAIKPCNTPQLTRREQVLMKKLATVTAKLKKHRQEIRNLKRRTVKQLSVSEVIEGAAHYVEGNRLLLIKMQLEHINVLPWSQDEKQFALGLYSQSPKAYSYLREKKDIALPCVTLIRQWINDLNSTTVVSPEVFE